MYGDCVCWGPCFGLFGTVWARACSVIVAVCVAVSECDVPTVPFKLHGGDSLGVCAGECG